MEPLKKVLRKLLFLTPRLTAVIALPSFLFVAIVLGMEKANPVLAYFSYLLSAYAAIITATGAAGIVRAVRKGIGRLPVLKKIRRIPIGKRYLDDRVFRAEVSLYGGLLINLLYVGVNLYSGIRYHSLWFMALSAYYLFLSLMRFLLLHQVWRAPIGRDFFSELRRYRLCGGLLLVLNAALSVIVTLVVVWNKGFEYGGYLIYVMAVYAFYTMILSMINVVRFRKYHSPVLSAAKVLNLMAALVSMLSLETAMLSQFDMTNDPSFRRTMTAVTGFAVCAFVLGMAIYMIGRATRQLKSSV